ncbi:MAG TPA: ABC transporter permease subunit [Clostridiales bacterium]|nr:ABC transporter permease subunit [Clostridiales bacterium]
MKPKAKDFKSLRRKYIIDGIASYTVLIALAIIWIIPIVWTVTTSFRGESAGLITQSFFPKVWTVKNYVNLFKEGRILLFKRWLINTLAIALCNMFITTFITLCVAYSLSRFRFKMRRPYMNIALILGMFPGFMAMTAIYIILGIFTDAQGDPLLLGNTWTLLLIYASGAGLGFFVSKGYFDTLSISLDEAALLDGASQMAIFFKIILPLSKPIIIYTALMAFMTPWADYVLARVILGADSSRQSWTVPVGLYDLTDPTRIADYFTIFTSGCVIIAVPIVLIYLSLQRFMVEGISAGAVKG